MTILTTGSLLAPAPVTATLANAGHVLPVATTGGAAPAVTFNGDGTIGVTNISIVSPLVGAYVEVIDNGRFAGSQKTNLQKRLAPTGLFCVRGDQGSLPAKVQETQECLR